MLLGKKLTKLSPKPASESLRCFIVTPREITFTSGGSEADTQAIRSAAQWGAKRGKRHIVSTKFEHHAVLHTLESLEKEGFTVTLVDVHENGIVRPEEVAAAIQEDTCLVSVMTANNEIGTIQPVEEIGKICREKGVLFHTDAVQAVGHIPMDVKKQQIDFLSLSAHKFHGPEGVGALIARKDIPLLSDHRRRRPGTRPAGRNRKRAGDCGYGGCAGRTAM